MHVLTETIPAALSRLTWTFQAPTMPRFASVRIVDDCASGRYDNTVYDVDTSYDFGDELFAV